MEDDLQRTVSVESSVSAFASLMRVLATVLGIVAIIVGLVYAMKIFDVVYRNVREPEGMRASIDKWQEALGADDIVVPVEGAAVHCGKIVTIAVIGCAVLILVRIAMGIMAVGGKIISWTAGDREAVKRILTHAFGPGQKPPQRA